LTSQACIGACALALAVVTSAAAQPAKAKHTNRLAREASPYLLLHAHNPTDWYPWGPEAFAKARKEKKLVFLSIGYSSCYWCHVMERESFNHEAVAKILNDSFVCIKVDREERPEIDHIYMTALYQFRSGGGWPLSMFLLPDGRPVIGGTYWPREDKVIEGETSPGFMTILKAVHAAARDDPDQLEQQAGKIAEATVRALENGGLPGRFIGSLERKLVDGVLAGLKEEFDPEHGGFGSAQRGFKGTKFPTPPRLELLLLEAPHSKEVLDMLTLTLDRMALGGIYDHIGGGFHRYSTERTWTVPHFEKMLYDNAQLVEVYARAYHVTKKPLYRRIVEETLAYIEREMLSPEAAFYSSQDAETHEEEGRFYVWTADELAAALPDRQQRRLIDQVYGTGGTPNFEGKYYILRLAKPLPDIARDLKLSEQELLAQLDPLRRKLYEVRAQRDRPLLNRIALTSWSGQMIGGLATAGQLLAQPRYVELAARAAEFVLAKQRTAEGRLLHTYGAAPGQGPRAAVDGYLEDYAFLVHGLLNLHDATGDKKWLDASRQLTDTMIKLFGDEKVGGFYFTPHDGEKFFARARDQHDGAQPSGNSMAARNLVRLARLTGDERYRAEAERTLRAFAGQLRLQGTGMTTMAHALALHLQAK
jgi:uncharacterized protein YyaL (SSP411 family)